ncbi:MAG: hypothetical protein JXB47_06510 [Anaerolineae bacterium]|nr:hypothetical protein [Anaerolineae bacterium]
MHAPPDLTGFIDLHIHTAPDSTPRLLDDFDAAREAAAAGMRGVLIKSHSTLTADRAALAQKHAGAAVEVWGGLALNDPVGGLNPAAVQCAIAFGAREIWMPTRNTRNENRRAGKGDVGLTVLDEHGAVCSAAHEVLRLIAEADLILGTGHISPAETMALIPAAREAGVKRILITHPDAPGTDFSLDQQHRLVRLGCLFERCWVFTTPVVRHMNKQIDPARILNNIRQVGWETTVLATDYGQADNLSPVEGLRAFAAACLADGFTSAQVRRMGAENPAGLVGA